MPNAPDRFVPLAVIRHAHGVRGEVKITSLTSPPEDFLTHTLHDEAGTAFRLTRTGVQPKLFICRIEGVTDRTQAEALRGRQIGAMRSVLGEDDDEGFYVEDFVGLRAITADGESVGTVRAIVNYGASDIVIIDTADGELMLPYAEQYFPDDPNDGTIMCVLPEIIDGRGTLSPLPTGEGGEQREPVREPIAPEQLDRARRLRRDATESEKALWNILRDRQFKGVKFRRQHPFGVYILDFVSLKHQLVIELDGGQHSNTEQQQYDEKRTAYLASKGWYVKRFWNNEILQNSEGVAAALTLTLSQRERELAAS